MIEECASFADREVSLWKAVILQALLDAGSNSSTKYMVKAKREALQWLFGNSIDFEDVCCMCDLDPRYVRRKVAYARSSDFTWRLPTGEGWRAKLNLTRRSNL